MISIKKENLNNNFELNIYEELNKLYNDLHNYIEGFENLLKDESEYNNVLAQYELLNVDSDSLSDLLCIYHTLSNLRFHIYNKQRDLSEDLKRLDEIDTIETKIENILTKVKEKYPLVSLDVLLNYNFCKNDNKLTINDIIKLNSKAKELKTNVLKAFFNKCNLLKKELNYVGEEKKRIESKIKSIEIKEFIKIFDSELETIIQKKDIDLYANSGFQNEYGKILSNGEKLFYQRNGFKTIEYKDSYTNLEELNEILKTKKEFEDRMSNLKYIAKRDSKTYSFIHFKGKFDDQMGVNVNNELLAKSGIDPQMIEKYVMPEIKFYVNLEEYKDEILELNSIVADTVNKLGNSNLKYDKIVPMLEEKYDITTHKYFTLKNEMRNRYETIIDLITSFVNISELIESKKDIEEIISKILDKDEVNSLMEKFDRLYLTYKKYTDTKFFDRYYKLIFEGLGDRHGYWYSNNLKELKDSFEGNEFSFTTRSYRDLEKDAKGSALILRHVIKELSKQSNKGKTLKLN